MMCAARGVSVGGFYDAQTRLGGTPHARVASDTQLRVAVRVVFRRFRTRYGAPRVHGELRKAGVYVAKHRVARFMHEDQLVARRRRRCVHTTDSRHTDAIAPNLLNRNFTVQAQVALDRVWVSDITSVPTRAGWLYLAMVLDLASRRIVGWAMSDTMDGALPLAALRMALAARRPAAGLILHSDRGSQYAAGPYRAALAGAGAIASMSRTGNCWDSAVAERFFATLEHELIVVHDWTTHTQARQDIFVCIE